MEKIILNFYGFFVRARSNDKEVLEKLKRDFSYFAVAACGEKFILDIVVNNRPPGQLSIPGKRVRFRCSEYIRYGSKGKAFVDYNGRASVVFNYEKKAE